MVKHEEQRVGVLVDVSNMYHSAKNLYHKRVNYKEVLKSAVAGRKLIRAVAYVIRTESEEETPFFDALYQQGFEVKMKDALTMNRNQYEIRLSFCSQNK